MHSRRMPWLFRTLTQRPGGVRALDPFELRGRDAATKAVLLSQPVDNDGDMKPDPDDRLFQVTMPAKGTRTLVPDDSDADLPPSVITTFARFVPERTDDFAGENDRVAFRTYGPNAQDLFDKKDRNGTLSSGMDCWLKRVPEPVIDRWHGRYEHERANGYRIDQGEGHDPYHVGSRRGIGGVGVLDGEKLYTSRNFTSYKARTLGPIRTVM